jgi:predicted sugar kinase
MKSKKSSPVKKTKKVTKQANPVVEFKKKIPANTVMGVAIYESPLSPADRKEILKNHPDMDKKKVSQLTKLESAIVGSFQNSGQVDAFLRALGQIQAMATEEQTILKAGEIMKGRAENAKKDS